MSRPDFTYPLRTIRSISSGFYSPRAWGQHAAVDFAPCANGNDAIASAPGRVVTAGWVGDGGLTIELEHVDPVTGAIWRTRYMHLAVLLVSRGQWVERGELLAQTDNTGTSTGPHLHFAIWVNRLIEALSVQGDPVSAYGWWAVDPLRLLRESPTTPVPPIPPIPPIPQEEDFLMALTPTEQEEMRDTLRLLRPWVQPGEGYDFLEWNHQLIVGLPAQVSGVQSTANSAMSALTQLLRDMTTGQYVQSKTTSERWLVAARVVDSNVVNGEVRITRHKIPNPTTFLMLGGLEANILMRTDIQLSKIPEGAPVPSLV